MSGHEITEQFIAEIRTTTDRVINERGAKRQAKIRERERQEHERLTHWRSRQGELAADAIARLPELMREAALQGECYVKIHFYNDWPNQVKENAAQLVVDHCRALGLKASRQEGYVARCHNGCTETNYSTARIEW